MNMFRGRDISSLLLTELEYPYPYLFCVIPEDYLYCSKIIYGCRSSTVFVCPTLKSMSPLRKVVTDFYNCALMFAEQNIMQTYPCNVHPLTPHFYIVKLGFTGVLIFSLYFCSKT